MRLPVIAMLTIIIAGAIATPALKEQQKVKAAESEVSIIREAALTKEVTLTETEAEISEDKEIPEEEINGVEETYVSPYDFETLKKTTNADIVAWVKIDGTQVDYPVLFDGTDQYLHMSLGGENSPAGSIYVDATTEAPFNESVNIIYGHHMKDGSMFSAIDDYSYEDFWNNHQNISIYMEDQELHLSPEFCVVGESDSSLRDIHDISTLEAFLGGKTVTQGEVPAEYKDMYVFVTCNYTGDNYRTYLFCTAEELNP